MLNTTKLLENKLFQERYIKPNINWYFSYLNGKRGFSRIYKAPYAALMKKFSCKNTSKNASWKE